MEITKFQKGLLTWTLKLNYYVLVMLL